MTKKFPQLLLVELTFEPTQAKVKIHLMNLLDYHYPAVVGESKDLLFEQDWILALMVSLYIGDHNQLDILFEFRTNHSCVGDAHHGHNPDTKNTDLKQVRCKLRTKSIFLYTKK
jgi:hypothetical protein